MPGIREYFAGKLSLDPQDRGVTAMAGAARRVQGAYNEAAEANKASAKAFGDAAEAVGTVALKYAEHDELTRGARMMAALQENAVEKWNETAKTVDPNDSTAGPRFMAEQLEPSLEKFGTAFFTERAQEWSRTQTANFRQHMQTKVTADMGRMAGEAVAVNLEQTRNRVSNTAFTDPSSYHNSLKLWEDTVNNVVATSPNLKGVEAQHIRNKMLLQGQEQITKSYLMGLAEKNPAEAKRLIETDDSLRKYISGDVAKAIVRHAEAQTKANAYHERTLRVQQKQMEKDEFEQSLTRLTLSVYPEGSDKPVLNPNFRRELNRIGLMPGANPASIRAMESWYDQLLLRAERGQTITTDPQVYDNLFERVGIPPGEPNAITSTELFLLTGQGKLSENNRRFFEQTIAAAARDEKARLDMKEFKRFTDSFKPTFIKSPLIPDPQGALKFKNFVDEAMNLYRDGLARGYSRADMLNPRGQHYLGKLLEPLIKPPTPAEIGRTLRNPPGVFIPTNPPARLPDDGPPTTFGDRFGASPPAPELQRLPNETPRQYLERIRKK